MIESLQHFPNVKCFRRVIINIAQLRWGMLVSFRSLAQSRFAPHRAPRNEPTIAVFPTTMVVIFIPHANALQNDLTTIEPSGNAGDVRTFLHSLHE